MALRGRKPGATRPCGAGGPAPGSPFDRRRNAGLLHGIARESERRAGTLEPVANTPEAIVYEVSCPHCGKSFREELLTGAAERYNGFKCPHCKLFVPFERVAEQDDAAPA